MLLEEACEWFGWPPPEFVLDPKGEGAGVCAHSAKQKIGEPLKRAFPKFAVETGILVPDPNGAGTAAPLAVICQFPRGADPEVLREAHRLAWNFSRTSLLITLEPQQLSAWSCFQDPDQSEDLRRVCALSTPEGSAPGGTSQQGQIRELLHWVSLITGNFLRQRQAHFPTDGRADLLLLRNLRHVRRSLIESDLDRDVCHDLLARIVFTQFLFHRKDSAGNPFFSPTILAQRCDGALEREHREFATILRDKDETYALFRWLDDRFNGDLFPGKEDQTEEERDAAWLAEKNAVSADHLKLLADLVSGTIDTTDRQLRLWPHYSFDTIPLEFISSVYEEFLTEDRNAKKAYYTPSHLVDYILDAVLPWEGEAWDLRVLDPACGSGIFLVKAFQRLIHRWRRRHGREPLVRDLKPLLENNFYGVDIHPDAVRVACFSLYLAMADAIDPKHYVTRERVFPRLRGRRLIAKDFFDETTNGFRTDGDAKPFDLVIGNAPWGENSTKKTSDIVPDAAPTPGRRKRKAAPTTKAETWAKSHDWPIANNDIGPLFVAKALNLVDPSGRVAMLQPALWLYHRAPPAKALRGKLFGSFTVDEVTNLSALRRDLFRNAIGPACVLVVGQGTPDPRTSLLYMTPKPLRTSALTKEFQVEPRDISHLTHEEAAHDSLIWSVLALGGRRDLHLVQRLSRETNLAKLEAKGDIISRIGVIPGDRKQELPEHRNKRYFDAPRFPADVFLELDAESIPRWTDPRVHSRDTKGTYDEFKNPQLLVKQSLNANIGRFRAALVRSSDPVWGVVCKKTYLSVHDVSPDGRYLHTACIAYNSLLATYFLFLTSSRLGHYITEALTEELKTVPMPPNAPDVSSFDSFEAIDEFMCRAFSLTEAERAIVEDVLAVGLPDALRKGPGPGRRPTARRGASGLDEFELSAYGATLTSVLKGTFGTDKEVAVTIYQEPGARRLPVRMVTIHLDSNGVAPLTIETIEADGLLDKLASFHRDVLSKKAHSAVGDAFGFQRVAYFFHAPHSAPGRVRSLTIIKPDEYRYWTRSQAMRDADELAAALVRAAGAKRGRG
ncbi:MAG TPA: N-6 DNA methylase [Pirellulales bacterium]|nr:N-6 DNA methylase [Pirellulales bacterium]